MYSKDTISDLYISQFSLRILVTAVKFGVKKATII